MSDNIIDRSQNSKMKSKKNPASASGFISFSAVSEPSSSSVVTTFLQPVYSGNDSELSQVSKKLIKKDSVTKIKALVEVSSILQTREPHILTDFLPYFIYVYCRLSIDNDRQVREHINNVLKTIILIDKKKLTPYMDKLIGYWWLLGSDTTKEVAVKASTAFVEAIPAKKLQQVTAHLAPHILNRCVYNLHIANSLTLSDTEVLTTEESDERYERVVISSLAGVGKLILSLNVEQNSLLLAGVDCAKEGGAASSTVTYGDVLNDSFWTKYMSNKSVAVRRSAYDLAAVVALHLSQYLVTLMFSHSAKIVATAIMALLEDRHSSNLSAAMEAFVSLIRVCSPALWVHVSVHKQLVPKLKHMLRIDPEGGLEYIVPVLGDLLAVDVAVCTQTFLSTDGDAEESNRNVDAVCDLLRHVGELAESSGGVHSNSSLLVGVKADVCVCEIATLLLLRRDLVRPSSLRSLEECSNAPRLLGVLQHLVQSVVLCAQSVAAAISQEIGGREFVRHWAAVDLLSVKWTSTSSAGGAINKNNVVEAAEAVSRVLTTLQRATDQEINLARSVWDTQFWSPLGEGLRSLLLASFTPDFSLAAEAMTGAESRPVETVAIQSSSVIKATFFLLDGALEGAVSNSAGRESSALSGAASVLTSLVTLSAESFATMSQDSELLLIKNLHVQPVHLVSVAKHFILSKFLTSVVSHAARHHLDAVLQALQMSPDRVMELLSGPFVRTVTALLSSDDHRPIAHTGTEMPSVLLETLAAHSLSDLFGFLGSHFRNGEDRARFTSRIMQCTVDIGSLYIINAFLSCVELSDQFNWKSESALVDWIASAAKYFLGNNSASLSGASVRQLDQSSLEAKLSFLTLVARTDALQAIADDSWTAALIHWEANTSKLAIKFVLTVLVNCLQKNATQSALATSFLASSHATNGLLETRLAALFFGRSRNTTIVPAKKHLKVSIGERSVIVVDSWSAVQTVLLPLLPRHIGDQLVSRLVGLLSAQISNDEVVTEEEANIVEGEEESRAVSQPARWARNLVSLTDLVRSTVRTSDGVNAALGQISLFQSAFWQTSFSSVVSIDELDSAVIQSFQRRLCFALNCLTQIAAVQGELASVNLTSCMPLVTDRVLFVDVLMCLEVIRLKMAADPVLADLASIVKSFCVSLFSNTSTEVRAAWMGSVLDATFLQATYSTADSLHSARSLCSLGVVRTILSLQFSFTIEKRNQISLSTPSGSERIAKGQSVWYLQSSPVEASKEEKEGNSPQCSSYSEEHLVLQRVAARVLAIHKETGSDPYYSIETSGPATSGAGGGRRELQTEWHKLLLSNSSHSEINDKLSIITYNNSTTMSSNASSQSGVSVTHVLREYIRSSRRAASDSDSSCDQHDIAVHWLETALNSLFHTVFQATNLLRGISDEDWQGLMHAVRVFCAVMRCVLEATEQLAHSHRLADTLSTFITRTRGLCFFLVALNHSAQWRAWSVGCELLTALVATKSGLGGGLWLSKVLFSLKAVLTTELKLHRVSAAGQSAQDAQKMDQLFAILCVVMGDILSAVRCPFLILLAEQLLPIALPRLPSPVSSLAPSLLQLLRCVWMSRKLHSSNGRGILVENASREVVSNVGAIEGNSLLDSMASAWEVEGFDLALFVMIEGLVGHSDDVRMQAASVLHFCMLGRSRAASSNLLEQSVMADMVPHLERILNSEHSLFSAESSSRPVESAKVWNTMRLTACKLLDNWVVMKGVDGEGDVDAELSSPVEVAEEASVSEQEEGEMREDERVFRRCMGEAADVQLKTRFSNKSLQQFAQQTQHMVEEVGLDNETDESESPRAEDSEGPRSSRSVSPSPAGKRSVEVGRRRLVGVILRNDPLGAILSWLLCLQRIDSMAVSSWTLRARCGNFLKKSGILTNALHFLIHTAGDLLKHRKVSALLQRMAAIDLDLSAAQVAALEKAAKGDKADSGEDSIDTGSIQQLAVYGLFRSVCTLPAMFRGFWNDDCNRSQKQKLELFVEERVRVSLIGREMGLIAAARGSGRWKSDEFSLKGSVVSGEVTATFVREETSMEIRIRLPPSYPLKNVEVTCTSKIGVSDGRWRRWVLQMIQLLSLQDGSVVDAALMWKCNVEKELEGVEPCPICYCVLHTKTLGLPSLACPTCNNKFHNNCLYTWFKSSGKSKCVICQQPFFAPGQQPRDVA